MSKKLSELQKTASVDKHYTEDELGELHKQNQDRKHIWRQRGNMIYCFTCPFEHGFLVKPDTRLTGSKDGLPLLDKFKIS